MFSTLVVVIYTLLVVPPLLYLLFISVAGMLPQRKNSGVEPATGKIGILVPSHNEALTIQRTVNSIFNATEQSFDIDINVIADNCTDNTADLARQTPANVLERHNLDVRGKGAALQWAMKQLADKNYDYFMIIDADSIVNKDFFVEIRKTLAQKNCKVVQARYEAIENEYSSIKRLALLGYNVLRARGRVALGGSAGIMGNGFVLSREALADVPFEANSIVEDLEYHNRLIEAGVKVLYCDRARIFGEMPVDDNSSDVQASRWEGGRLGVLKTMWWPLLKKGFSGHLHAFDALLDLMLLPIGYVVMLLIPGLIYPPTRLIALAGIVVIAIYVLGAAMCGRGLKELTVLAKLPSFMFKKIKRLPAILKSSQNTSQWNRTPRSKKDSE